MIKRGNKKGYEFNFSWLFSILIGAVVLFLAIYSVYQLISTTRLNTDSKIAKEIGFLLTPIETNLEDAKVATIILPAITQLKIDCSSRGNFGSQTISVSSKSSVGSKWPKRPGIESTFKNKYLFSKQSLEADEKIFILSKPFKFPYKIADLQMTWSDHQFYCFVDPPEQVMDDIDDLNLENIAHSDIKDNCPDQTNIHVCFNENCNIRIYDNQPERKVEKNGIDLFYVHSFDNTDKYGLMYAAIFSDPDTYECQLERLLKRSEQLAELYQDKLTYYSSELGCIFSSGVSPNLLNYKNSVSGYANSGSSNSNQLRNILDKADELKSTNDNLNCRLF